MVPYRISREDLDTVMGSPWTSKNAFGQLAGELAAAQDREFERAVLPFVHLVWPSARISPPKRLLDGAGIDLYVGSPPHFTLVIQCKGFLERELLTDQLAQCRASLAAFERSRYSTDRFILLWNRHELAREYHEALDGLLKHLIRPGKASVAALWNHRDLLKASFDEMLRRVKDAIRRKTSLLREEQELAERVLGSEPLREVPIESYELQITPARLRSRTERGTAIADPLTSLFSGPGRKIGVLVGVAGLGKTTTAMRATREWSHLCIFLPASRIRGDVASAHTLFESSLDADDVLDDAADVDRVVWGRIIGPVLKYMTQDEHHDLIVIIDALDEAPALEHSYDLQRFFNLLGRVRVPVVVTMRTEFWLSRRSDFDAPLGEAAETGAKSQRLRVIELQAWSDEQILQASESRLLHTDDADAKKRVREFVALVRAGEHEASYGDLARSPLFLKFILDVLQDREAAHLSRAQLLEHWIRRKILRDVAAPTRFGGHRVRIRANVENADDTVALAFQAMAVAAIAMIELKELSLTLLPTCSFSAIRTAMQHRAPDSPTSLMLNSVLIAAAERDSDGEQRMRFAHRIFHEYFLARAVRAEPEPFRQVSLPTPVAQWIAQLDLLDQERVASE